jgi:transcriptional regulator with XRE-family HTH domain
MTEFSQTLRNWRQTRRFSQLDLALEADVSARHISFLETGRARPSREMILRLGEAMHLPLSAQNILLTHAGFAARFAARDWQEAEMAPIRAAIAHTLQAHTPYPAIALDQMWNIVRMNTPARVIYGMMGLQEGDSLLDVMLLEALPQLIENWPEVAHHTALRLRTESNAMGGVTRLEEVAAALSAHAQPPKAHTNAVVPMILTLNGLRLSLFGTIAQFGTPEDVALDELKIELFFPSDDASKAVLETLAGNKSQR